MKLKDYNTTAKMYQLFLQFKEGQFSNSTHGVRYLNKLFDKAKNEPTIISSWAINEVALDENCNTVSEKLTTLKDSIYRECESDLFNGEKFSSVKSNIIFTVLQITQIPRDLINFSIIMKPKFDSNGNNNITEDTIYNNKDYVLTVNITTPLNDLMRFALFFYKKWMDAIEGKRLMQKGYKKTLEKYKSTEINKELLDENKNLKAMVKSLKSSLEQQIVRDADSIIKIENTFNQRMIEQVEMNHRKNIEFDELIYKKDNEIKRLTKENEDFLKLINERDSIIKKQSESLNNDTSYELKDDIKKLKMEEKCLREKISNLTESESDLKNTVLFLEKQSRLDIAKLYKAELELKEKENFIKKLDITFDMQYDLTQEINIKYLELKQISEDLAIQNSDLYVKNKYNENLAIAYSNACKDMINTFGDQYIYKEMQDIINEHIDKIPE